VRETGLGAFASKLLLVVGQAAFTPAGYEMGPEGLVYLNATDQGDGRVLLQSAALPGVATGHSRPSTLRSAARKHSKPIVSS
jgi:hypothetical protein